MSVYLAVKYDMVIDVRKNDIKEALKSLKAHFSACGIDEIDIEVITASKEDAKQVRAFASMSGFRTALHHEDDHYKVSITGTSCGCSR